MVETIKIGKALSWDELADIHDKITGQRNRTKFMQQNIWDWAKKHPEKFYYDSDQGTFHFYEKEI